MEIQPPSSVAEATVKYSGWTREQVDNAIQRIWPYRSINTLKHSSDTVAALSSTGSSTDFREEERIEGHRLLQGFIENPWTSIHDVEIGKMDPFYLSVPHEDMADLYQHTIGKPTGVSDAKDPRLSFTENLLKLKEFQRGMDNEHSYQYLQHLFTTQISNGKTYYQHQAEKQNQDHADAIFRKMQNLPGMDASEHYRQTAITQGIVKAYPTEKKRQFTIHNHPIYQFNKKRAKLDQLQERFGKYLPSREVPVTDHHHHYPRERVSFQSAKPAIPRPIANVNPLGGGGGPAPVGGGGGGGAPVGGPAGGPAGGLPPGPPLPLPPTGPPAGGPAGSGSGGGGGNPAAQPTGHGGLPANLLNQLKLGIQLKGGIVPTGPSGGSGSAVPVDPNLGTPAPLPVSLEQQYQDYLQQLMISEGISGLEELDKNKSFRAIQHGKTTLGLNKNVTEDIFYQNTSPHIHYQLTLQKFLREQNVKSYTKLSTDNKKALRQLGISRGISDADRTSIARAFTARDGPAEGTRSQTSGSANNGLIMNFSDNLQLAKQSIWSVFPPSPPP
jgi:hypothetical protein